MIIGNWQVKIQELPGRYSKALHIWRKVDVELTEEQYAAVKRATVEAF